jgi:hypothetical protein
MKVIENFALPDVLQAHLTREIIDAIPRDMAKAGL